MTDTALATRPALVRRGLWLNYLTIGYNTLEAIVALAAGWWPAASRSSGLEWIAGSK
jgi:hypothetical protein